MKSKRALLFFLLISLFGILAFIPREDGGIEKLVASLHRWTDTHPQEKVYLHMDKPYYALGDTIWFKAYVTIGSRHQLSAMSGALYVELINPQDSLLRSLKLPLVTGTTYGDFTLDDKLPAGNYRIRAYTQWMRNAGEDYFFDRTIMVGSVGSSTEALAGDASIKVAAKASKKGKKEEGVIPLQTDVQFFPESGNLVNGIASRIGFKAVGLDGNGVSVKGVILDDLDKEIIDFESLYAGMGNVVLKPESGRTYHAKVLFPDSSEKVIPLPKALEDGYVLGVYQTAKDSVLVRINASPGIVQQKTAAVNLVVHVGGEVIFTSPVKISRSISSVWLHKALFPSGIAQFTLFNGNNEPLNERIAFIKSTDQMELTLSTDKKTYKSREKIELALSAKNSEGDAVAGNFSVTVIDEDKVKLPEELEHTIFSDILLTADLKGYIENPNYYFSGDIKVADAALDNLMLTQGYRRFVWKELMKEIPMVQLPFKAEQLSSMISGKVQTLGNKPVANGKVTLMSAETGIIRDTVTDASGRFAFNDLVLTDGIKFSVQARTGKNGSRVEMVMDSVSKQNIGKNKNLMVFNNVYVGHLNNYLNYSEKEHEEAIEKARLNEVHKLKEVNIKAVKAPTKRINNLNGPDHYDQLVNGEDLAICANLRACLEGQLRGVIFKSVKISQFCPEVSLPYTLRSTPPMRMLVVLDGRQIENDNCSELGGIFDFNDPSRDDIESIEVLRSPNYTAVYGDRGRGGVILINTKRGGSRPPRYNPSIVNIAPKGFNKTREFYAPRYDRPGVSVPAADLRSTVYWNPNLRVYASGKSTFSYFNADGPGNYKVIVEGINAAGELARSVYRYQVEAGSMAVGPVGASSPTAQSFVKAVDSLRDRMPVEKVYLHTDKSYYNLGDTLWFKSYLMNGTGLAASSTSGLLYVELLNDSADVVRRISIPVTKGLGWAQIPLPRTIFHEGAYSLRAYTNWMQNFGEDYFFSKRFYLGVPTQDTWLVKSASRISKTGEKDFLDVELVLSRTDLSPAGFRAVEVRLMEGDRERAKENIQTRADGRLSLKYDLKERFDGRNMRVLIRSLHENDGNQQLSVPLIVSRNQAIDLQFLPEGGHMVAGLKSVVGFKAIGEDGKGIQVKGEIIDSKRNKVGVFSSLHNGMGSFELKPLPGEVYTAILDLTDASKKYPLPLAKPVGTVMYILNPEEGDSIKVTILASDKVFNAESTWLLTTLSGGRVTYTQPVSEGAFTHTIPKKQFPSGVTRFTLLRNRTPINERLIYVDHGQQLQIAIEPDKSTYFKRDSVSLAIHVKDKEGQPVKGHFSLSVTDDTQVGTDTAGNHNIGTALLLTSELKGAIETPGYYLNRRDKGSWKALDNLMLTQGWTGYQWKDIFNKPDTLAFEPELKLKVKGTVTNILKKPVAGAQMLISSQKPAFLANTLTDSSGRYTFENLPEIDSGSFFIQARTPVGKTMNFGEVTVESFKPPVIKTNYRDQVLPWYVNSDPVQLNYVKNVMNSGDEARMRNSGIALKEVKIQSKKVIRNSYKRAIEPDIVFDEQDIKESAATSLYQILRQKLPGFHLESMEGLPTAKLNKFIVDIFADGNPIPIRMNANFKDEDLKEQLSATMIASFVGIEVYYSKQYGYNEQRKYAFGPGGKRRGLESVRPSMTIDNVIYQLRSRGSDQYLRERTYVAMRTSNNPIEFATIHITTKYGSGGVFNNRPDYATLRPLPIMHAQEFYSPKYVAVSPEGTPDYRATVYWAPDIITDRNGMARVSFYSADIPGTYTLNLQGSDMSGGIGSVATKIKVGTQGK